MNQTFKTDLIMNPFYRRAFMTDKRYIICKGGAGAGKSFAATQDIIRAGSKEKLRILISRKIARTIKQSVFTFTKKILTDIGLTPYYHDNKTDLTFIFPNGTEIISCGMDDPDKLKSIFDIDIVLADEFTDYTEADFEEFDRRLRGGHREIKKFIGLFNPVSDRHWIKSRFFDKLDDDTKLLNVTYKENLALQDRDPEYIKKLERYKETDEYYYKVFTLGEWGSIDNDLIFTNCVVHDFEPDLTQQIRQGLDFGFNHAMAFMRSYIKDGELYIFDERYEVEKTIDQFLKFIPEDWKNYTTIADSSRPDNIETVRRAGFRVYGAQKGPGSVMPGIDYMKSFPKIHIHRKNCPGISREKDLYKFRRVKGDILRDEPVKENDDAWDAVRYSLEDLIKGRGGMIHTNRKVGNLLGI